MGMGKKSPAPTVYKTPEPVVEATEKKVEDQKTGRRLLADEEQAAATGFAAPLGAGSDPETQRKRLLTGGGMLG